MKLYETMHVYFAIFLPPLYNRVRYELIKLAKFYQETPHILDVGGRKSYYTCGVPAYITISDLNRKTDIQNKLSLGLNKEIIEKIIINRSNVTGILFDNMTCSSFHNDSFHCIVAVEVLEHVEMDDQFVKEVYRILKPQGVFLMTTPNGDFVKNDNPDHIRHYTRKDLISLLSSKFEIVNIEYAIRSGFFRNTGLRRPSAKRPLQSCLRMLANLINTIQSSNKSLSQQAKGTDHLIAVAKKY
jgi:SAM-dependent methyltransferase